MANNSGTGSENHRSRSRRERSSSGPLPWSRSWWKMPSTRGPTAVTVEIRDGGTSFIRVTDNGSGIDREPGGSCLFAPFHQQNPGGGGSVSRRFPGIPRGGLVQYRVHRHGGADYEDAGTLTRACAMSSKAARRRPDRRIWLRRTAPPFWCGVSFITPRPGGNF